MSLILCMKIYLFSAIVFILQSLEDRIELCEDLSAKEKYNVIKVTAEVTGFKVFCL